MQLHLHTMTPTFLRAPSRPRRRWAILGALACTLSLGLSAVPAADESNALFSGTTIPRLRIEIPEDGMKVLREYRQVWGQPRPERIDVRATVRDGDQVYTNVAVHLKGSYTFLPVNVKPSLTLNFDKFADKQRYRGLDKIHLNNSVQDPSYLCEKLARDLFSRAGVPAARAGHARVELNGNDLGFYVLVEGYNKRFLKRHFTSVEGNLYDGGSGGDVTKDLEVDSGDPDHREDLKALAAATRESRPALRAEKISRLVDTNRFMTFAALEVLLLHWDGYCLGPNNFRLFRDASVNRFVFLPHGLDQILGRGASLSTSLTPKWDGVVARGLFKTPGGRQQYLQHARQTWTNYFQPAVLTARLDEWAAQLRRPGALLPVELEPFDVALNDLKRRVQRRAELVRQQIENPPGPVTFDANGELPLANWQPTRANRSGIVHRRAQADGREMLEVGIVGGKWAAGSWRQSLLLAPGRYELTGRARTVGLSPNPTNGVILRLSGDLGVVGITNSTEWVTLRREFTVAGEAEEELVCEYRGPEGSGQFDPQSLKLRRMPARLQP